MRNLVIGDVHAPCQHPGYLAFCRDLHADYRCNATTFIGDICDWHAISFHAAHPDAPGPKDEYELAYQEIERWAKAFPVANVCIGNHDERLIRLAETVNIPSRFLRDYKDIWGTPGWDWGYEHIKDDVYYFHGTGNGGQYPAYNAMKKMLMSTVMGHIHTASGVKWAANPQRRIFGMDTGCGIDDRAYAFAYGRHMKARSILSAGVVLDGIPFHHVMPCGPGEKYHRSNFHQKETAKRSTFIPTSVTEIVQTSKSRKTKRDVRKTEKSKVPAHPVRSSGGTRGAARAPVRRSRN